jgi:hypothetical protein
MFVAKVKGKSTLKSENLLGDDMSGVIATKTRLG